MARNIYTVTQVNGYIKNMFTQDYMLQSLFVKGEVSNCKYHSSGHIYFTLKDSNGAISCAMFSRYRAGLNFRMTEGQQVVVFGTVDVYERDGKYQLYAKQIALDGAGVLYEQY
ncbi:MAG: exodeoxyribonuclease VII large subunit, partial [Lachnospiraceae bacterium]|nr:exodeoxyribonuclease VII large subunit [Lachnospiraceae bacterium]